MHRQKCKTMQEVWLAKLMHASHVEAPWKQVIVDLVGSLPRSSNGHTWLLVLQDRFTKWVKLNSLRRATATVIAQNILGRIVYCHGLYPDANLGQRDSIHGRTRERAAVQPRHPMPNRFSPRNPLQPRREDQQDNQDDGTVRRTRLSSLRQSRHCNLPTTPSSTTPLDTTPLI